MTKILAGFLKNQKIVTPSSLKTRPTSSILREAIFNICQNQIEDSDFLDVFAGSGAIGIEALSRGAKTSTFIENNLIAYRCIKRNISNLNLQHKTKVFFKNAIVTVKKYLKTSFDLIYIDPPYKYYEKKLVFELLQIIHEKNIIKDDGIIFLEAPTKSKIQIEYFKTKNIKKFGDSSLYILIK